MIYYHGTTSEKAKSIQENGFLENSYFTTSIEDAMYYAATGGEDNLQEREVAWMEENGESPREVYETWEMMEALYPQNNHPAIIVVDFNDFILSLSEETDGADGAIMFKTSLSADCVVEIIAPTWEEITTDHVTLSP